MFNIYEKSIKYKVVTLDFEDLYGVLGGRTSTVQCMLGHVLIYYLPQRGIILLTQDSHPRDQSRFVI